MGTMTRDYQQGDIEIKYIDLGGQEKGSFTLHFDAKSQFIKSYKSILEQMPNSWVMLRKHNNRMMIYFTSLISYRCAIDQIHYSINSNHLDQTWPLAACDPINPMNVDGEIYKILPADTRFVMVKIRYRDKTESKMHRYELQ